MTELLDMLQRNTLSALQQLTPNWAEIGLVWLGREDETQDAAATNFGFLFCQIESGHVLKISLSLLRRKPLCTMHAYIIRSDGRTLSVWDYVRLHVETGVSEVLFLLSENGPATEDECKQALLGLIGLLGRDLKPILLGLDWENVQLDFQGYK